MRRAFAIAGWLLLASPLAQAACGYVDASAKPPASKDLYRVVVREVDGVKVDGGDAGRIKLDVGMHRILVQERIADERRGRSKLGQIKLDKDSVMRKIIEINIQADGAYLVAAQLIEKPSADAPADYWEPVVWRKQLVACR